MKVITSKNEYPNMTDKEIIKSGIALAGDALEECLYKSSLGVQNEMNEELEDLNDCAKEKIKDAELLLTEVQDAIHKIGSIMSSLRSLHD